MKAFAVPIKVRNWLNQFLPPEERGEDFVCEAIVDSGAINLSLPAEAIEQLKLKQAGTKRVYTADGGEHHYRLFGVAELEVQGRSCRTEAIELPRGTAPLLGAIPLEQMDWHISPLEMKLLPNPKSPHEPLLPLVGFTTS